MGNVKILIVDDDYSVRRTVRRSLEIEDFQTFEVESGEAALLELAKNAYDLVILDINMYDMDGFEVISKLRKNKIHTPVFLLSGRTDDHDKILGYGIGADAYITKPFSPSVLSAMVKSKLKSNEKDANNGNNLIQLPPFTFDKNTFVLFKDNVEVPLTSKEAKLMRFFMENKEKVFTKDQLYSNIWNETAVSDNNIMVFIRKIRLKIEDDPNEPKYLKTVWGTGYMFTNRL